ncbi:MAG TPA: nuclear transport factor 2 family protein [Polyangia bacterium]|jgi:ketosteroid isomerase-like protein|nr:nuclear transport factor 2 family protein [Polyangia bacterium]
MSTSADKAEVLEANLRFYEAFAERNIEAMEALWSRSAPVACIHPGWGPLRDREQVMASWTGILGNSGSPRIRCSRATAHVMGDAAFVVCEEMVESARLVATNMFVREGTNWKIVHHQASPIAHEVVTVIEGDPDDDGDDSDGEGEPGDKLN